MSGSQSLPFSEGNCDGRDIELNFYDRSRKMHRIDEEGFLPMSTSTLSSELCCPICLDLLTNTMTTKECLHRFCAECITTALLRGNKECPTCRKKLVSKRSLRPDPNMDSLIEKLWPDRQIYELMQSKCMEEFTQQNNIDSLRSSIEEGIKAQAANRRQRVTGSYDIGKKERRKREDELAGEPSQSSTPPQEVIFDDVLNEDENNGDSMPMIDVGEDGNSGGSGNSGGEGNGSGRKAAFENGRQNGMDCDIGEAEDGGGDESMDDEEEIDEQMMQEWDRLAAEEMLDDIPDDYSSSSSSSDSSSSSNGSSELELSSISDDNTVPAQNGEIEEILRDDDAELPKGTVPLTDRMQKWLAENPNSPPSDEMGDGLERTNEDGLLEIGDGETEIEAQFIPSRSLQERFKEWSRPGTANDINRSRFLKTAHSTTMSHFGQYLWDCYASELGSMAEFQDNQLLVKPQYFYVFNQETGHHIRRIFEEETFLVAHGASSRDHHLQIFFDTIEPKPSSETSLLETVVPPEFLEGKVILQQSEPS